MGDENKRPWYSKKTDTFELADSTPYGEQTEEAIKVADKGANPKFMGFGYQTKRLEVLLVKYIIKMLKALNGTTQESN
jgi:hypothetical protein